MRAPILRARVMDDTDSRYFVTEAFYDTYPESERIGPTVVMHDSQLGLFVETDDGKAATMYPWSRVLWMEVATA